jgi:hypothetical protein
VNKYARGAGLDHPRSIVFSREICVTDCTSWNKLIRGMCGAGLKKKISINISFFLDRRCGAVYIKENFIDK